MNNNLAGTHRDKPSFAAVGEACRSSTLSAAHDDISSGARADLSLHAQDPAAGRSGRRGSSCAIATFDPAGPGTKGLGVKARTGIPSRPRAAVLGSAMQHIDPASGRGSGVGIVPASRPEIAPRVRRDRISAQSR